MIPQVDPLGRIFVAPAGVPVFWNDGVGYTSDGRMCTTTVLGPNDQYVGGWRLDPLGRVVVAASLDSQIAALFAAGEQGCWYDPSDMSTLFQDTAGTVPVTAVGQQVARINDKSGRGNFAIQATAASRPLLQQDGGGRRYLAFDGVDDTLATGNISLTATNSLTFWAGVYKASDASTGLIAETSVNAGSNLGAANWSCGAPTPATWGARNTGTLSVFASSPNTFPAPSTAVLAAQATIATDTLLLRINGVQVASVATDQGTGNYGNFPLFLGARSGGTVPLNGRIYGLILRGAASNAAQIASGEAWCNSKAGAY